LVILLCISVASLLFKPLLSKKTYILVLLVALLFFFFSWKLPLMFANLQNDMEVPGGLGRALKRTMDIDSLNLIASCIIKNVWIYLTLLVVSLFAVQIKFSKINIPTIFLILYLVALLFVYFMTPHDLTWHLGLSINRTLMPINLLMLGITILIIKNHKYL